MRLALVPTGALEAPAASGWAFLISKKRSPLVRSASPLSWNRNGSHKPGDKLPRTHYNDCGADSHDCVPDQRESPSPAFAFLSLAVGFQVSSVRAHGKEAIRTPVRLKAK
jgi:hypothetical protein